MDIEATDVYSKWYRGIRDKTTRNRIDTRLWQVQKGNFGDHKGVGGGVCELRCDFAGGIRIYYTCAGTKVVLLLAGGNKSTQRNDIKMAKALLQQAKKEGIL